jgi:protein-S-isoprenylcysteine O-methyltransferase Ste14
MGLKAKRATAVLGTVMIGGALLYAGVLSILFGVVVAVGALIPWWISAVGFGVLVAIIGFGIMRVGLGALQGLDPAPRKTLETLREDGAFLKEQLR